MIYKFTIGTTSEDRNLDVTYDKYGNKFFEFPDIRQKLQIKSNVNSLQMLRKPDIKSFIKDFEVSERNDISIPFSVEQYKLYKNADKAYKFVNNRKNLKPMLFTNFVPKDAEASEYHIVYIAVEQPRYKILTYATDYPILSSFGKTDKYTGCVAVVDSMAHMFAETDTVFKISFFDTESKVYKTASIIIDGNGNPDFRIDDADSNAVAKLKSLNNKYKGSLKIRIRPDENSMLTQVFICKADENGMVEAKGHQIPANTVTIDPTDNDRPSSYNSAVDDYLFERFKDTKLKYEITSLTGETDEENERILDSYLASLEKDHITAITTIDVDIPIELLKKYSIRNVIALDISTGKSYSRR